MKLERKLEIALTEVALNYFKTGYLESNEFPNLATLKKPIYKYEYKLNSSCKVEFGDVNTVKKIIEFFYNLGYFKKGYDFISLFKTVILRFITNYEETSKNVKVMIILREDYCFEVFVNGKSYAKLNLNWNVTFRELTFIFNLGEETAIVQVAFVLVKVAFKGKQVETRGFIVDLSVITENYNRSKVSINYYAGINEYVYDNNCNYINFKIKPQKDEDGFRVLLQLFKASKNFCHNDIYEELSNLVGSLIESSTETLNIVGTIKKRHSDNNEDFSISDGNINIFSKDGIKSFPIPYHNNKSK